MGTWKFEVETKEAGQRRRYGDSFYHYIVESELPVHQIERFCRKVLKQSIPKEKYDKEKYDKENNCADNHFRDYCTHYEVLTEVPFLDDGMNKVEYKVVSPSTH